MNFQVRLPNESMEEYFVRVIRLVELDQKSALVLIEGLYVDVVPGITSLEFLRGVLYGKTHLW